MQRMSWTGWMVALGALGVAGCSSDPAPMPAVDAGGTDVSAADIAPTNDVAPADVPAADAPTGPLPDLTVDSDELSGNVQYVVKYFAPTACEIAEGCVAAPGWRRLLMFTSFTPNIGDADLNLGSSTTANANFEYSTCHMHYHFRGYADYSLLSTTGPDAGAQVALGHKQSFCVEDLVQVDMSDGIRTTSQFRNCGEAGGRQGISRGWADDYYPNLPCQWVDVTDVPAGNYNLQVSLNSLRHFAESDYSNNIVQVPVTLPASFAATAASLPTRACTNSDPDQGMGRNCGWRVEGTHTCTPGATITAGCNELYNVGSCTDGSSWDVRVCRGSMPCNGGDLANVLGADSGDGPDGLFNLSSTCGVTRFTCPAEGMYTVMKAPDYTGAPGTCTIAIVDSSSGDGGVADGGTADASVTDAGTPDAGATDAGATDAATGDAGAAAACTSTGGTVDTTTCCLSTGDFPGSCGGGIGGCSCGPGSTHTIQRCTCPTGRCFNPALGCVAITP